MKRQKVTPDVQHVCDECRFASYDYSNPLNMSIDGKPTLIVCELQPFPKIVTGSRACEMYEDKERK